MRSILPLAWLGLVLTSAACTAPAPKTPTPTAGLVTVAPVIKGAELGPAAPPPDVAETLDWAHSYWTRDYRGSVGDRTNAELHLAGGPTEERERDGRLVRPED